MTSSSPPVGSLMSVWINHALMSMQSDLSSVRVLKSSAKVSPEPTAPTPVPELKPTPVFGVALETLRQDGQMICGIPGVLRDMVEYLNRNGMRFLIPFPVGGYIIIDTSPACILTFFLSQECNTEVCSGCVGQWHGPGSWGGGGTVERGWTSSRREMSPLWPRFSNSSSGSCRSP